MCQSLRTTLVTLTTVSTGSITESSLVIACDVEFSNIPQTPRNVVSWHRIDLI